MTVRMLMLSVSFLLFASVTRSQPSNKDMEKLQGTWQAIRLEADGEPAPKDITKKVKWIFKADEYTGVSPEMDFKGKFAVKPTQKPKEMDLVPAGSKLTMLAIYKLDGDELTICIGKSRPSDFTTKEGSDRRIYVLKRVKN